MSSRRSRPTLQGRRNLDAKSHASGARGETSASPPGGRGTGISSRGTRLGQGGDAGTAGRAPRLDTNPSGHRSVLRAQTCPAQDFM